MKKMLFSFISVNRFNQTAEQTCRPFRKTTKSLNFVLLYWVKFEAKVDINVYNSHIVVLIRKIRLIRLISLLLSDKGRLHCIVSAELGTNVKFLTPLATMELQCNWFIINKWIYFRDLSTHWLMFQALISVHFDGFDFQLMKTQNVVLNLEDFITLIKSQDVRCSDTLYQESKPLTALMLKIFNWQKKCVQIRLHFFPQKKKIYCGCKTWKGF